MYYPLFSERNPGIREVAELRAEQYCSRTSERFHHLAMNLALKELGDALQAAVDDVYEIIIKEAFADLIIVKGELIGDAIGIKLSKPYYSKLWGAVNYVALQDKDIHFYNFYTLEEGLVERAYISISEMKEIFESL